MSMSRVIELAEELLAEAKKENEGCTCGCRSGQVQLSELKPGELFDIPEIGKIKVLEHFANGTTAVIQNNFWEEDVQFDGDSCDYKTSALREKFENGIEPDYEEIFGNALVEHEVILKSVDMQDYGKFSCKVRPITFDEARKYNDLLVNKDLPDWWWTCTPWSTKERGWEYPVSVVSPSGYIGNFSYYGSSGVRPFCILKSNIFVSKVEE